MAPARKKARVAQNVRSTTPLNPPSPRVSLTTLPVEILAEILKCTHHPPTVLAVSRTCSSLYRFLAQNPDASFIWRAVRQTFEPTLPHPGNLWKNNEADYAAFVFGAGVCEVCRRHTSNMYASFAIRIRLCGSWHCRLKLLREHTVDATALFQGQRGSLWVPHVESSRCFRTKPTLSTWPFFVTIILRKTDLELYQRDVKILKDAEQAQAARKAAGDLAPVSEEEAKDRERTIQRCNAAVQRFPEIMNMSVLLDEWKYLHDCEHKSIKQRNREWTRNMAQSVGWDLDDLVASQTYGSLQRRKNFLLEAIEEREVTPLLTKIESEILAIQVRRKRQKAEATYKERLGEAKKIYQRMRCGSLKDDLAKAHHPGDALVFPPMNVFCMLPSVRALRGSPDPNAIPSGSAPAVDDIKTSPLIVSLIRSDIRAWLIPVQKHVLRLLGCPDEWQCASTLILPPWQRVTARFFCRECGEGKVGRGYQRELCLDFKGVCSHVCVGTPRKGIESREGETDKEGGKGKSNSKGRKKVPDWNMELFEKDEKAIRIIRTILARMKFSEKHRDTEDKLKGAHGDLRCQSCKGWIVMDFETAIGHAHRHECMEIDDVIGRHPRRVEFSKNVANACHDMQDKNLAFERGTTEFLLGRSQGVRGLWKKVNYGCRHCLLVEERDSKVVITIENRAMTFDGLRSHVKAKHGIQDIRDEDFFCYTSIQKDGGKGKLRSVTT